MITWPGISAVMQKQARYNRHNPYLVIIQVTPLAIWRASVIAFALLLLGVLVPVQMPDSVFLNCCNSSLRIRAVDSHRNLLLFLLLLVLVQVFASGLLQALLLHLAQPEQDKMAQ